LNGTAQQRPKKLMLLWAFAVQGDSIEIRAGDLSEYLPKFSLDARRWNCVGSIHMKVIHGISPPPISYMQLRKQSPIGFPGILPTRFICSLA
jgi:hypothetical protein